MVSDFLNGLANLIEDNYGVGENQNHSLDIIENGHTKKYGRLGNFAKQFDQSAQRKYLDEGYLRLDPFNVNPKLFEVLLQEPDATILIKKRAFSTLSENYRSDVMDKEEKLYLKATKILFQNKCKQISTFEKLTKIARVTAAAGQLDDQLMPLIISLVDEANNNFSDLSFGATQPSDFNNYNVGSGNATSFQKLSNTIDKVRKIYAFSPSNDYTTWIADNTNIFQTTFGQGTGVIELTNVSSITTETTVDFNSGGRVNLSISDPYGLMRITEYDIEKAISDSLNFVANKKIFQLGQDSIQHIAADNIKRLNDARAARGASNIEFIQDPNTFLGKKLRAVIEHSGIEINFDYNPIPNLSDLISGSGVNISKEGLRGGPIVGNEGLDNVSSQNNPDGIRTVVATSEVSLFSDAVSAIFTSIEYTQSASSAIFADPSGKTNMDLNFVRRKMRFHYANKLIAQPMDRIHIYLNTKSRIDDKILGGLNNMFSGLGFFQNLNNNVYDIKNQFDTLFNPSQNIDLQLEKSTFVGNDFPNGLWAMMRNTFVNDKSGTHVFGGIIDSSSQDYTPGKFTVSISGKDNTHFFDFGVTNLNPGVDNFAGPLYDPLTPFKTKFDTVSTNFKSDNPEFLDENKEILGNQTFDKGLIKFKSGRYAGKPATKDNFFHDKEITKDGNMRNVYHGVDGLVYKWKEGIGTFTYNADSFSATDPERIGIPPITKEPFAGQDIINVLSLLITGTPYNYSTYFRGVSDFDNSLRDPHTNVDPAVSFYNSINSSLKKNDLLWGAFVPFKNLVIDEASYQAMLSKQVTINNQNSVINTQLKQIQDLKNKIFTLQATPVEASAQASTAIQSLQKRLTSENSSLNIQLDLLKNNLQGTVNLATIGNDVSFDPSQNDSSSKNMSDPNVRDRLRKKVNFLTRRLSWAVRANEDKNLLIIDDSYDKDYDILAYEKALNNSISQFNSEYTTVRGKIAAVASLLNLEVFCDTQGHIRIRPQQYNRMPSSVFYRMMQMKQINKIQIYPNFLEDLYVDQINSLLQRMEVLELQIRLDGAIIGLSDDNSLSEYLNGIGSSGGSFDFFSDSNGDITNIGTLISQSNPDLNEKDKISTFDTKLKEQNSLTSVFNTIDRALHVSTSLNSSSITGTLTSDYVNQIITKIFHKSGQNITLDNFLIPTENGNVISASANLVDIFKVNSDLSDKILERQKLVKILYSSFKNAQEAKSLDDDPNNTSNKLLFPNLYKNKNIPEIFSHMIEDETYDDYGPGSGTRYIIKNHQIIRISISEIPPEFTMLEVQGQLDPFISNNTLAFSGSGSAFPRNGNAIVTAAAVDYDLWRMYGFRNINSIAVPFLSNPETQCAPYAVSILSRIRKEILQGTITIAGNEFMQPGEVVYIEDMGLLFYVQSVSHDFTFGSGFRTTLVLKYGHNPGEYIPTPLDVIGKILYNNRDISGYVNYRQTNVYNENAIGAIIITPSVSENNEAVDLLLKGNYGEYNLKCINNILYSAAGIIASNGAVGTNVKVKVELRVFYDKSTATSIDSTISDVRDELKKILINKSNVPNSTLSNVPKIYFSDNDISLIDVDISDKNERRSPSQRAIDQARNLANGSNAISNNSTSKIQSSLFLYVIDCVVNFVNQGTNG